MPLRAGQDAYGAAIQETGGGAAAPAPAKGGMSQTDFGGKKQADDPARNAAQAAQFAALMAKRQGNQAFSKIPAAPALTHGNLKKGKS